MYKLTLEQIQELLVMYDIEKISIAEIAKVFHLTYDKVKNILIAHDIAIRMSPWRVKKTPKDYKHYCLRAYGKTPREYLDNQWDFTTEETKAKAKIRKKSYPQSIIAKEKFWD